jgi:hypothetical protein
MLHPELFFIADVPKLASAAFAKHRTVAFNPVRGGFDDILNLRIGMGLQDLQDTDIAQIASDSAFDKYGHTADPANPVALRTPRFDFHFIYSFFFITIATL